jgi:hypothetical protein
MDLRVRRVSRNTGQYRGEKCIVLIQFLQSNTQGGKGNERMSDSKPLTDEELRDQMRLTAEDAQVLRDLRRGKVQRGAFAMVAAMKMSVEAAHHTLVKDAPQAAAPVVIVFQGMEGPQDALNLDTVAGHLGEGACVTDDTPAPAAIVQSAPLDPLSAPWGVDPTRQD